MSSARIQNGSIVFRQVNLAFFAAGFVTFITLYDVQPLLPEFAREFGISPAWASLPLSTASFTLAAAMLLAGTLSEVLGRKSVMICSLFLTSILALLTAFSYSFSSLVLLRFVQGMVLAGLPPVAMAYLSEEIEPAAIGTAMGLYISGNAIGGMSGRLFTAALTDCFSWHMALGLIGVLSLGLSIYFSCSLPPSANFRRRPFDSRYFFASVLQPLRDPHLLCLYGVSFMVMGSFVALFNYITFRLLGGEYGLSQTAVSLVFLTYIPGACSSSLVGRLVNRFGRFFSIRVCVATMLTGIIITLTTPLPLLVAGITVFTCGFFGAHTIASTWVGRHAKTAKSQATALYLFFYYLGASIAGTVGGFCWASGGWQGVAGFIGLLLLAALVLISILARLAAGLKENTLPARD